MNCVVIIAGREAVPVRAIPFADGWRSFTPDELARGLAHRNDSGKLEGLAAHCIAGDGSISSMLPKEWDAVVDALDELSMTLKKEGQPRSAWRERSIRKLPSHCFVWRDELESAAESWWLSVHIVGEREGDKGLNFAPWMRPGDEEAVLEGIPRGEAVVPDSPEKADSAPADSSASMSDRKGWDAEPKADDVQAHQWGAAPARRQRHDDLALELERILAGLRKQGKSTARDVMDALKKQAGRPDSCIAASIPEGISWTNVRTGDVKVLTMKALQARLKRI